MVVLTTIGVSVVVVELPPDGVVITVVSVIVMTFFIVLVMISFSSVVSFVLGLQGPGSQEPFTGSKLEPGLQFWFDFLNSFPIFAH